MNEAKPGQSDMKKLCAILSLVGLAACGGNPFVDPDEGGGDGGPDPVAIVVPANLKNNIQSVKYTPGATRATDRLEIQITGLDTTPLVATWARRPSLDTAGYTAFAVQEDALDRLFIGLARSSADNGAAGSSATNSVSAVLAGDGGQFNKVFSGTVYAREGAFDAPTATGSGPGTGQVSYAGRYVGLGNGGGSGAELLPLPPGTDPATVPGQAGRVRGDVFINANFADSTVGGVIFNRVQVDTGFGLESVVLVPTSILANGTFGGTTERSLNASGADSPNGIFGGVFGGTDASAVAGAISLNQVFDGDNNVIEDALERGIFVLNQCGLAGVAVDPGCAGTAP